MNDQSALTQQSTSSRLSWLSRPWFWFAVALVIRLLYLLEQAGSSPLFYLPLLDEKEAVDSALEILNGAGSAEPYFKAPGYSWILAVVMTISGNVWPWVIRLLQHICGAWMVAFTAGLAGRLVEAGRARKITVGVCGVLGALYAPLIRLETNLSLDFWVVFFQTAMLAALAGSISRRSVSNHQIVFAGLWTAVAWLTRPTLTLCLPFIALWIFLSASPRRSPGQAFVCTGLFLLPVILAASLVSLRNHAVSGQGLILPWQGGYSFYQANKAGATGRYFLQSEEIRTSYSNPARAFAEEGYLQSLHSGDREQFQQTPDYHALNQFWFDKGKKAIKANPEAWLKLMFQKGVYLLSDKEIFNYEDFDLQRELSPILQWLPGRFGIVFPLALASLVAISRVSDKRKSIYVLLWIYIATLGGAIALYFTSGRMRMPIAPPMIALSGAGATALLLMPGKKRIAGGILVIVGVVISWGDWWGVRSESMAHADLARMSNAAWHRNRFELALEYAIQAEKLKPDYPVLPRLKAQALYNLGLVQEAEKEFQRSVEILNDDTSKQNLEIIRQHHKTNFEGKREGESAVQASR